MTILNTKEAAKLLRVSPRVLRRLIKTRVLPHNKLGRRIYRFRKESLEAWMEKTELGKLAA
jgi:excisionase family DNA binding protein